MTRQIGSTDTPQLARKDAESPCMDGDTYSGQDTLNDPSQRPRRFTPSKTLGVAIVVLTLAIALVVAFVR